MSVGLAPELRGEAQANRFELTSGLRYRSPVGPGVSLVILLCTALALALRLYMLSRPNYLLGVTGYDDGVEFGSALRLVDGTLPYRDYAFVQPPGITVLLAPVALLAKVVGTDPAFAVARVLTALAGAAGVALVGRLVRHHGVFVVTFVCGLFAISPDAILASHSVLLEPWLVLFCLSGLLLVFEGDRLSASPSRCALGGAALGIACVIKVWALLPAIVLIVYLTSVADRRRTLAYLAGLIAAPVAFASPFVANAPGGFLRDVVLSQLARTDTARVPLVARLMSFAGLRDLNPRVGVMLAVALAGSVLPRRLCHRRDGHVAPRAAAARGFLDRDRRSDRRGLPLAR